MAKISTIHICLAIISMIDLATGYYCDSDRCGVDEYCCGSNQCCTSYAVWQMWYFWCGLVFFVILLSACAGFCRYRFYHTAIIIHGGQSYSRLQDPTAVYSPLPTDYPGGSSKEKGVPLMEPPSYTPNYPPPAYSAPDKDPNYKR